MSQLLEGSDDWRLIARQKPLDEATVATAARSNCGCLRLPAIADVYSREPTRVADQTPEPEEHKRSGYYIASSFEPNGASENETPVKVALGRFFEFGHGVDFVVECFETDAEFFGRPGFVAAVPFEGLINRLHFQIAQ